MEGRRRTETDLAKSGDCGLSHEIATHNNHQNKRHINLRQTKAPRLKLTDDKQAKTNFHPKLKRTSYYMLQGIQ